MASKFSTVEIFDASLALDHNFWAFTFDMLKQLRPRHMLVIFMIAYVTSELGALVHGVLLQLAHCFPDYHSILLASVALVGEFAKVYAICQHLIDVLQKVSASLATGAADVVPGLRGVQVRTELQLAVLAEQLVAVFALQGLVREVATHDAVDFFRHFSLQFVLDLGHFDVELGNWFGTHNPVDGFVTNDHVELLGGGLVLIESSVVFLLLLLSGSSW